MGSLLTMAHVVKEGLCKRVELKLNEMIIVADFLVVELGSVSVVLRWLDTIGTIKVHWPSFTMTFWVGEKQIEAKCSLKALEKTWGEEDQGFLTGFQHYEIEVEDEYKEEPRMKGDEENLPMIKSLLRQYGDIFEAPKGLPPKRVIDHRILTIPEQRPMKVRPYKYGYVQKEEIEKLVTEMLQAREIRPSHSPYSSSVLLVKKKRWRGWRFCVDYRKLKQVTTFDIFPNLVIEELLDELDGATVFEARPEIWISPNSNEGRGHQENNYRDYGFLNLPTYPSSYMYG